MKKFITDNLPSILIGIILGSFVSIAAVISWTPKHQTNIQVHIEAVDISDDMDGDGIPDWFYDLPEPEARVIEEPAVTVPEAEPEYSEEDLVLLAHLLMGEAGADWCSDEMVFGVGSVALNRVSSSEFPNTLEEVVYQEGQYACVLDGNIEKEPTERCWQIAKELLINGSVLPEEVLFQAEFEQGSSTYMKVQNMYFCNL